MKATTLLVSGLLTLVFFNVSIVQVAAGGLDFYVPSLSLDNVISKVDVVMENYKQLGQHL